MSGPYASVAGHSVSLRNKLWIITALLSGRVDDPQVALDAIRLVVETHSELGETPNGFHFRLVELAKQKGL
jgi:hypothetical protein